MIGPDSSDAGREQRRLRRGRFLKVFRWTIYTVFSALMVFLASAVTVGIVTNIDEPYPEIEIPEALRGRQTELSLVDLRGCREALTRMRAEDLERAQAGLEGVLDRDRFLAQYRQWAMGFEQRFERLGIACRLTQFGQESHPAHAILREIYRRLDDLHHRHLVLIRRFVTENGRTLNEIRGLLAQAELDLDHAALPEDSER